MSSHSYASASDSTGDYWRYINISIDIDITALTAQCSSDYIPSRRRCLAVVRRQKRRKRRRRRRRRRGRDGRDRRRMLRDRWLWRKSRDERSLLDYTWRTTASTGFTCPPPTTDNHSSSCCNSAHRQLLLHHLTRHPYPRPLSQATTAGGSLGIPNCTSCEWNYEKITTIGKSSVQFSSVPCVLRGKVSERLERGVLSPARNWLRLMDGERERNCHRL